MGSRPVVHGVAIDPSRSSAGAPPTAVARPVGPAPAPSAGPTVVSGLGGSALDAALRDLSLDEADIPAAYVCSITGEIMRDPVVLVGSGNTYEREAIATWLRTHSTDPLSNVSIPKKDQVLVPNVALRSAIDEFVQAQKKKQKG